MWGNGSTGTAGYSESINLFKVKHVLTLKVDQLHEFQMNRTMQI